MAALIVEATVASALRGGTCGVLKHLREACWAQNRERVPTLAHLCPPLPTRQPATDFRSRDCGAACTRRTSAAPPVSSVSYYARGEKKPFPTWCRNGICAAFAVYLLLQVFLWQQTSSAC